MPVVRVSNKCSSGEGSWWKDRNKELKAIIAARGISDIKFWTSEFDLGKEWLKEKDEEFKKQIESGFSITRNVDAIAFRAKQKQGRVTVMKIGKGVNEGVKAVKGDGYLYKNAGELKFKKDIGSKSLSCENGEAYFPLDLVILGDSKDKIQTEIKGNKQTIKITDDIKEVIGVRLNQVFIKSL